MFLKTATLITLTLMCRLGSADLLVPGEKNACTRMNVTDAREVKKLMEMIPGKAQVENFDGGKVQVQTKEVKLGGGTTMSCTTITQDGKDAGYFRGQRPGCTIVSAGDRGHSGSTGDGGTTR